MLICYLFSYSRTREDFTNPTSSSGAESQHADGSMVASGSGVNRNRGSCSPPLNPAGQTKKKRSLLKLWNKPDSPRQQSSHTDHINIVITDEDATEDALQQAPDTSTISSGCSSLLLSPPNSPPLSPRESSATSSSSSSRVRSLRSSHYSTLSLPIVLEDREYVSFLEF